MIKLQHELETKFNKNQQIKRLMELSDELVPKENSDRETIKKIIAHMIVFKRANLPTLVGVIGIENIPIIERACEEDYLDFNGELFITKYDLSEDSQKEIDMYMFPIPLVVEPREVESVYDSGYHTDYSKHMRCVTNVESIRGDISLDVLNIQNKIPLTINMNIFQNTAPYLKGIEQEEDPFKKRKKQGVFKKFNTSTKDLIQELMSHTDRIYLTHFFDKRGRLYNRAYHVNYQGFEWQKAVVEFADKELVEI